MESFLGNRRPPEAPLSIVESPDQTLAPVMAPASSWFGRDDGTLPVINISHFHHIKFMDTR